MTAQIPVPATEPVDVDALLQGEPSGMTFLQGPVSITDLFINLVIGLVLALVLQWHYRKFANPLSSKENFARVFPLVLLTTLLIITIVKSSLALSLGLVGALSIVRFRTPIKEPEELAYLFICIAMGLGLGASQTLVTIAAAAFTFVAVGGLASLRRGARNKNLFLSVNWPNGGADPAAKVDNLNKILADHASRCDLRRVDSRDDALEAHYFAEFSSASDLTSLMEHLRREAKVDVTFVDQSNVPIT